MMHIAMTFLQIAQEDGPHGTSGITFVQAFSYYFLLPAGIAGGIALITFALTAPKRKGNESPITHIE